MKEPAACDAGIFKQQASAFASRRRTAAWITGTALLAIVTVGWVFPWLGYFVPLCMILGILPAFSLGRKWCDWWCPRGSFLERYLAPLSRNVPIPGFFRRLPFRLFMLTVLMTVFSLRLYHLWPNPVKIGGFFVMFLTVTTVLAVLLGLAFKPRNWCAFCPIGTMASWASANKNPLRITPECTTCKVCEKVCPLGITPYAYKDREIVADWDCLKCRLCVTHCPKQCLSLGEAELRKIA